MRFTLRKKFAVGLGGLVALLAAVGIYAAARLVELGDAIDAIMRDNYRSVVAADDMKEAVERTDSGLLFVLAGWPDSGAALIDTNLTRFDRAFAFQRSNITEPGEDALTRALAAAYAGYRREIAAIRDPSAPIEARKNRYRLHAYDRFVAVKDRVTDIRHLNQEAMVAARDDAASRARAARRHMAMLLVLAGAGAIVSAAFLIRSIDRPIRRLTESAREIARGNLDLVVGIRSGDEIGELASAFDTMAEHLRIFRKEDRARFLLVQNTTQRAIDSLPDAIVVVGTDDVVELTNRAATNVFGFHAGVRVADAGFAWLAPLIAQAREHYVVTPKGYEGAIQVFYEGEEHFYLPRAVAITGDDRMIVGFTVVLADVTGLHRIDELKSDLVSTVSHELETPLTSIRMGLHLLAEERVGPLNPKQAELAVMARQDADRLHGIIANLLDLSRIEAGKVVITRELITPRSVVLAAIDPILESYNDRKIKLEIAVAPELPKIQGDPVRLNLVLTNLLSNALKYTEPGGSVRIEARREESGRFVRFAVSDTGRGIPPEDIHRIFERFYRGGDGEGSGLGLAISREIVRAHGGEIRVESEVGEGSTFTFTIPVATSKD